MDSDGGHLELASANDLRILAEEEARQRLVLLEAARARRMQSRSKHPSVTDEPDGAA